MVRAVEKRPERQGQMFVQELMSANPVCCTPGDTLEAAARMMAEFHCGALPVVSNNMTRRVVGIITDRDITCRATAKGDDPRKALVGEFMSAPVATVKRETTIEACIEKMEAYHVRRLPVINDLGQCEGIIAQGDIAMRATAAETAELIRRISRSVYTPSRHEELMATG